MLAVQVHKAPAVVLEKLSNLFDSLHAVKERFEKSANNIADKMLQRTLRSVAQESCQYANELSCQIQSMGGDPEKYFHVNDCTIINGTEASAVNLTLPSDEELLKQCTDKEIEMIKAYRDLLNESNLYGDLRNMIRYQLNGIMYGFLQIKLLIH
jgi:uncharacterized protein (TIGR02284 family)